jgi:hypothetical protein
MLLQGRTEIKLRTKRGGEGGRKSPFVGRGPRGEQGQVLLIVVLALPLLFALVALVSDGSNVFANKRSLQNAADSSVLAAVKELNLDFSLCTGPATTSGTCLNRVQTVASDYTNRNSGPTPLHQCDDTSGPDTNCYQTPYPKSTDYGGVQVRLKRSVPFRFGRLVGLSGGSVSATAAASIGLPGSASNVSPIAVQQPVAACTMPSAPTKCFGPSFPQTLNFDSTGFGYALLNLHCATDAPASTCPSNNTSNATEMDQYMISGYPGFLDVNKWYVQNNGVKNGIKGGIDAVIASRKVLFIPVYDCVSLSPPAIICGSGTGQPAAYRVIGFAAFVIQSRNGWNNGQGHTVTGYFTQFVGTGVGGGGTDFGARVVTLSQ